MPTDPTPPPPWPNGMERDVGQLQDPDDFERRTAHPSEPAPGHFELDGCPVRFAGLPAFPERLDDDGVWRPIGLTPLVFEATRIDRAEFQRLVAEVTAKHEPLGPAEEWEQWLD